MIIRTIALIITLTANCVLAQTNATNYEWKATMIVVDQEGIPVTGASATIGFYKSSKSATSHGITDTNGTFTAFNSVKSSMADVSLLAEKPGFYPTMVRRFLGPDYDPAKWIFTQTLVLKKVAQPIAMYAKRVEKGPPVFNEPVGYDLMIGDWVGPYGKGVTTDVIFNGKLDKKAKNDFDYKLTVSFPKAGDGIQGFAVSDAEKGSGLRSPHEAPINAYQTEVIKIMSRHPGQGSKDDMNDPNRNYVFRVRTILDQQGNITSAHYGKIYGDFMQFTYYLNPTPNSRNIEFDPRHNLLGGLQPVEEVSQP